MAALSILVGGLLIARELYRDGKDCWEGTPITVGWMWFTVAELIGGTAHV